MKDDQYPTGFREMGFLGSRIAEAVDAVRKHLGEWTSIYFDLNRFAQKLFYSLKVDNKNPQQLIAYSALYRSLTAYQTLFLLVERGIDAEAKIILRSMTEAALVATAASKSKDFVIRFIKADEDTRRKLLRKTLSVTEELAAAGHKLYVTPLQLDEMRKQLAELDGQKAAGTLVREIGKEEIAKAAGLVPLYLQHFAYFSLYTHLTPSGMRDLVITNEKGEITDFRSGVYDHDALPNLRVAIVLLIITLHAINHLFVCNVEAEINSFNEHLEKIMADAEIQASLLTRMSRRL